MDSGENLVARVRRPRYIRGIGFRFYVAHALVLNAGSLHRLRKGLAKKGEQKKDLTGQGWHSTLYMYIVL